MNGTGHARLAVVASVGISLALLSGCSSTPVASAPVPSTSAPAPVVTPSASAAATPVPSASPSASVAATCLRVVVLGYSVQHRAITACERGTPAGVSLLVVGNLHGDEQLGLGVVARLRAMPVPAGVDLWLVSTANPDGTAARRRTNAHGVDENRNFPYHWASSATSGPRVLSEPETQALATFLTTYRPHTVLIFHSPLDAVDYSEGADPGSVRYLAAATGFPARTLGARPGELSGWYNGQPWHPSAITFEFARAATSAQLDRVSRAVLQLATWRRHR